MQHAGALFGAPKNETAAAAKNQWNGKDCGA